MRGSAIAPVLPRRCAGVAARTTLILVVIAALAALLVFSMHQQRSEQSGHGAGLLERGMSPGHRLLNAESGRTLPSNAPRIRRADALVTRVSSRFRLSKDKVVELALATHGMIARQQPEDVLDVLDAAMFATDGLAASHVPALAPVLAAYAKARTDGASVASSRAVARSFAEVAAQDAADGPPRR